MKLHAVPQARPTPQQAAWQQMELGLFIHWFPMGWYHDIGQPRLSDAAYRAELLARCTCATLDTRQWARSATDLGAKYLVFVAKHALGFCAWQTDEGDFNMKRIPWKNGRGDVVAELAASCREAGIRLGIYLAADTMVMDAGARGLTRDPAQQAEYTRVYRAWLKELLTRYGDIVEVWFDGSLAIEVGDILQHYAPRAMVFQSPYATIRWVGQEEGYAADPAWHAVWRQDALSGVATQRHGDPDGDTWLPLECDARLRRDWGFHHDLADNPLRSLDELLAMYYGSVGRGAVLLLNQAPHPQGHILPEDMARMKELGDEIRRRFARPLASGSGSGAVVELDLGGPKEIDHVMLQEDISQGQRVRAYRVAARSGGQWRAVCAGSAIGYKKIDCFEPLPAEALRFTALESAGTPILRTLAAFRAGRPPAALRPLDSAWIAVGEWGSGQFDHGSCQADWTFNLSPYLPEAGQYALRFAQHPGYHDALRLNRVWLEVDGVPQDSYLSSGPDALGFALYLPAVGRQVALRAQSSRYDHPPHLRGQLLLRRADPNA